MNVSFSAWGNQQKPAMSDSLPSSGPSGSERALCLLSPAKPIAETVKEGWLAIAQVFKALMGDGELMIQHAAA